ncbi:Gastricsin-like protein [Aphelenchoides besseyi]|nr:Gastricsin-like protein [Aphelenchoides besseyi]KAI6198729.1 Gastricsin-like protein [Aphelenchoides besseyi]
MFSVPKLNEEKRRTQHEPIRTPSICFSALRAIRPFRVGIDLSTSLFWFFVVRCNGCPVDGMRTFDPHRSFTYKSQGAASGFVANFRTDHYERNGSILGYRGADYMVIDLEEHGTDDRRFFIFSLVTAIQGEDQTVDPMGRKQDGRIGLSLNSTATLDLLFLNYDRLLCMGRNREGKPWLTIGQSACSERKKFDDYVNLTSVVVLTDGWTIAVQRLTWDDDFEAQLSTTTSYLNARSDIVEAIARQLSAVQQPDGRYFVDCSFQSSIPKLSFKINGVDMEIKKKFIVETSFDVCELKLRPTYNRVELTLGLPFMDSFISCLDFDERMVSFMRSLKS